MKQLTEFHTDFISVAEMRRENGLPDENWRRLRKLGQEQFALKGLPGKKDEDWKYTSLWTLSQQSFNHDVAQPGHVAVSDWQLLNDAYHQFYWLTSSALFLKVTSFLLLLLMHPQSA